MDDAATTPRPQDWSDWLFLASLALFLGWAGARSLLAGWQGESWAYLSSAGLLAAGFLGARLVDRQLLAVLSPVAVVVVTLALVSWPLVVWRPGLGPLGYANANAALAVQLCALAALCWVCRPRGAGWVPGWVWPVVMLALGWAVALNQSVAAALVGLPTLAVCLAVRLTGLDTSRIVGWAGLIATVLSSAAFCWLSAQRSWDALYERLFSPVRHRLWLRAWEVWHSAPWFGTGPGSFQRLNPLGADPDTAPAHSALLQVGAELGWAGVALLALIVATGFLVLLRRQTPGVSAAAAAWAAFWTHSLVDHLTEFWPVPLAVGVVLGLGTLRTARRRPG